MEEDDDLETLRLAALQTIKPRKIQSRHNENPPYYRLKNNSNLIEIVPNDDSYVSYSSNVSKTVNSKDVDPKNNKFDEKNNDLKIEKSEEQKTVRSKFRTDSNNDRKILKLDEDQLDFECEDLLEINDDDSLERLMDEMEQELIDKTSNISNTQNVKKGVIVKKYVDEPKKVKPKKLIVIDDRISPKRSLPKNNYKRSLSPVDRRYSPIRSKRYGSPKLKSPRRSPRSPSPRRSLSPRFRTLPRLRSYSPKRRSPSPRRRSRSPRLRRSPILRSRRSPSPRLRRSPSPRMKRSPILRSKRPPSLGRKRTSLSPVNKSLSPRPISRSRRPLTPLKDKISRLHRTPSLSPPRRKRTSPIRYKIRSRSRSPILLKRSTSPRQKALRKSPSRKRSKSPVHNKLEFGVSQVGKKKTPSETKENSDKEIKTEEVDPKLEARRKKFESNIIVAPVRKKIRLKSGREAKIYKEDSMPPEKIRLQSNKIKTDDNISPLKEKRLILKNPKKKQIALEQDVLEFEENPTNNLEETDEIDITDNKTVFSHISTKSTRIMLNRNLPEDIPDQTLDSNLPKLKVLEKILERRKAKIVPITYTPETTETKKKSKRKKEKIILKEDDSTPILESNIFTKSRQYVSTKILEEETDNGNDLRAELSRRRAERLKDTKFQPAARIIQSAFEGVVSNKKRSLKSTLPNTKALKKTSILKGRRVRVVDSASESEDHIESYEETNPLQSIKIKSIGRSAIIKRNKV